MKFLEKDLEDIIHLTPNSKLKERGLVINGFKLRQPRIGNYGIADLITIQKYAVFLPESRDSDNEIYCGHSFIITIYELKKDNVTVKSLSQSIRYYKGVQQYLESVVNDKYRLNNVTIKIVLIGSCVDQDMFYLGDVFDNVKVYTYCYEIDGLTFQEIIEYKLTESGFKR